jgi:GR25 family glycosyltransferase involved in LPS biosynthesis
MKNYKYIFIVIIIIILIFYFFCFEYVNLKKIENMDVLNDISFNVITLSNLDRLTNIEEQEKILNIKTNRFDAIKGNKLNQDELVRNNVLDINFKFDVPKRSNEIGCYLSHLNLLKSLKTSKSKYHVVLEDDFKFVSNTDFIETINKILEETKFYSFDIIFLGWTNENESSQQYFSENLYWLDDTNKFYGAYGYLVNSDSLEKIINLISLIDMPIDVKYKSLYLNKQLNVYWSKIKLIEPNYNLASTILAD